MAKKIKVVDVAENEVVIEAPVEETPIVEPVVEEPVVEEPAVEESKAIEDVPNSEPPKQILKQSISDRYITCDFCNKNMLMKTYKYSHKKLCETKNAPPPPPPPPPPPSPEPKKRIKRESKPKVAETKEPKYANEVLQQAPPNTFNGVVSFNDFPPVDPYTAMREQRLIARQSRVKSLISQAI